MMTFIHDYMCNHRYHAFFGDCHFYPWATTTGTLCTIGVTLVLSAGITWFITRVIKPEPGCLFEGKVPLLPLYAGDPRGYRDVRYRTKYNGGQQ